MLPATIFVEDLAKDSGSTKCYCATQYDLPFYILFAKRM